MFQPTRQHALERLKEFIPMAGSDYARKRNFDLPEHPHVSKLSPFVRHRIISEQEVLASILGRHSYNAAEKSIQEVFWRTYWKGWLELRPQVWRRYICDLDQAINQLQTEPGLRENWARACNGQTHIACFNRWATELAETGYLHNHARMWFASIWIFTLRLPWQLGADFFLRHLLDGDPASNTLSWRWVAGLQTEGKTYLARQENIRRYTDGIDEVSQDLAKTASPLPFVAHPAIQPLSTEPDWTITASSGVLITEEDMSPQWLTNQLANLPSMALQQTSSRSSYIVSATVIDFVHNALNNTLSRMKNAGSITTSVDAVVSWAVQNQLDQIISPYAPTGPTADALESLGKALSKVGISLIRPMRPFDRLCWPHATHGFFKFRQNIPEFIAKL